MKKKSSWVSEDEHGDGHGGETGLQVEGRVEHVVSFDRLGDQGKCNLGSGVSEAVGVGVHEKRIRVLISNFQVEILEFDHVMSCHKRSRYLTLASHFCVL